jgi:hypothetical protein
LTIKKSFEEIADMKRMVVNCGLYLRGPKKNSMPVRQESREVKFGQDGVESNQIKCHTSPSWDMSLLGDIWLRMFLEPTFCG